MSSQIRVLVVFANPRTSSPLRLSEEDRVIKESIRRSRHRERFQITTCHAATVHDLRRALLDDSYHVVHISGHGTGAGLVLETETGAMQVIPREALSMLFSRYAPPVGELQCVLLNACYSMSSGRFAALSVPYTIAMEGAISDAAAIEFVRGFYDAAGAGRDYAAAYDEGELARQLATPDHPFVAHLLRQGEAITKDQVTMGAVAERVVSTSVLVGFAVDLSGSMRSSIRNDKAGATTRLKSFQNSLERLASDARTMVTQTQPGHPHDSASIDVFIYGFGLRPLGVQICDLLSLLKVVKGQDSKAEIELLKARHTRAVEQEYAQSAGQYSGLAALARQHGFGGLVHNVEQSARRRAEDEVRQRVVMDVARSAMTRLAGVGNTTLSATDLVELWKDAESSFSDLEEFIYGATPMRTAMEAIAKRFDHELHGRRSTVEPLLFLISDGDPTDGNPLEAIAEIKNQGVTVVSCFVTDADLADPRTLYGTKQPSWTTGASTMFEAASLVTPDSEMTKFLLRKGWSIHQSAKLFVQINHSDVLDEFIRVLLAPLQARQTDWQLPRGE